MRERKKSTVWEQMDAVRRESNMAAEDEGFTVAEYGARYSLSHHAAKYQLYKMVRDGKLVDGHKLDKGGKRVRVFRFPE